MLRHRWLPLLICAMLLGGCAGSPRNSGPAPDRLAFLDSRIFDEELSRSLSAGHKQVTVDTSAGVSIDKIPERMDKWLYTVREADREVVAKPKEQVRMRSIGLVALIQAIATGTYGWLRDSITYSPARRYNATLIYDKATGNVEKIVFDEVEQAPEAIEATY